MPKIAVSTTRLSAPFIEHTRPLQAANSTLHCHCFVGTPTAQDCLIISGCRPIRVRQTAVSCRHAYHSSVAVTADATVAAEPIAVSSYRPTRSESKYCMSKKATRVYQWPLRVTTRRASELAFHRKETQHRSCEAQRQLVMSALVAVTADATVAVEPIAVSSYRPTRSQRGARWC